MATYHQLTLFDVDAYASECNTSDAIKTLQLEESSMQVKFKLFVLNLLLKLFRLFFRKKVKQAD